MILDSLANAARYRAIHPRIAAAFDFLASFDPSTPDSKFPIDGDAVHVMVQSYATKPAAEKKWESHRRYLDVQYVVSGRELIHVAMIDTLGGATEYSDAKDIIYYDGPRGASSSLLVEAGHFAIFLPQDGHKPGVQVDASSDVKKVVVKVML